MTDFDASKATVDLKDLLNLKDNSCLGSKEENPGPSTVDSDSNNKSDKKVLKEYKGDKKKIQKVSQ